jgi:hypothetical protein
MRVSLGSLCDIARRRDLDMKADGASSVETNVAKFSGSPALAIGLSSCRDAEMNLKYIHEHCGDAGIGVLSSSSFGVGAMMSLGFFSVGSN